MSRQAQGAKEYGLAGRSAYAVTRSGIVWRHASVNAEVDLVFPAVMAESPEGRGWLTLARAQQMMADLTGQSLAVAPVVVGVAPRLAPRLLIPPWPDIRIPEPEQDRIETVIAQALGDSLAETSFHYAVFYSPRSPNAKRVLAVVPSDMGGRGGWTAVRPRRVSSGRPSAVERPPSRGTLGSGERILDAESLQVDTLEIPTLLGRFRAHRFRRGLPYLLDGVKERGRHP